MPSRDKNSSLIGSVVNYNRRKFYNVGPSLGDRAGEVRLAFMSKYFFKFFSDAPTK
jgi:hypothetical protein